MSAHPIILGVAGDAGSGKSTLARGIRAIIGDAHVTHLCADDYRRFDRVHRAECGLSPMHPLAHHLDILELDVARLKAGLPILKPVYDHRDGTFQRPEYVRPRDIVIVEGLLCLHTPGLRGLCDVRVHLDPEESVRVAWHTRRDAAQRGDTGREARAEHDRRDSDAAAFVRPQRQHADIVIQFSPAIAPGATSPASALEARLVLRPTRAQLALSDLLTRRARLGTELRLELGRDGGRPVDVLEIEPRIDGTQARVLESAIWEQLPEPRASPYESFGCFDEGSGPRHSDQLALVQLLVAYHLLATRADGPRIPPREAQPLARAARKGPQKPASTRTPRIASSSTASPNNTASIAAS